MKPSRRGLGRRSVALALSTLLVTVAHGASEPLASAMDRPALKIAKPAQAVFVSVVRAGNRLVAVGERGLVVLSDDAGRSWHQADVPVSVTLAAVRFADSMQGWAAGHQGVILSTPDGGVTWRRVLDGRTAAEIALNAAKADSPSSVQDAQRLVDDGPDKPFLSLAVQPDGSVLALGAFGLAFLSHDGGASWVSQMTHIPNPDALTIYGLTERAGQRMLFGEQGLLLSASDLTAPFQKVESPTTATLFGALALDDGTVLLMGLRGKIFRSSGPKDAWEVIQTPVDASLFAGTQLHDGRVLLVGAAGQLLLSRDRGRTFESIALKQRFPFSSIAAAPDGSVVLAGVRGLLRLEAADFAGAESRVDRAVVQAAAGAKKPGR